MEQSQKVSTITPSLFGFQTISLFPVNQTVHFLVSDEDYTLQFAPPFHRLEFLQAQSCPDVITSHLELLMIFLATYDLGL